MANREYNYDDFATELLDFISNLTIKNKKRADSEETADSAKNGSKYVLAIDKSDFFISHTYTKEELLEANIPLDIIKAYIKKYDNRLIPEEYHDILLENKRKSIIENYEELNDYYRMLNGEPNYGEKPLMTSLGYITDLTINQLYQLEQSGEYEKLVKENQSLEYLKHLGSAKVSYYEARKANAFYILNYKKYILSEEDVKIFTELYYQSYIYVTSVLYNPAFTNYDYYESFMILLVVFMTMQKYISNRYTESIKKDFYDMESIKNTFLSYGLPFYEEIPIRYQKNIIKNLNQLLKYKGTDKVLVDIVRLFGFSNTELFKYYLIKDIKRDDFGNPVLDYENPKNNYELKFAQVPLLEMDITQSLKDSSLYQSYDEVIKDDPFWGDKETDIPFKDQIMEMEFNYINTKYISMNTVFEISKVNLETCQLFNMINKLKDKGCIDTITFISNNLKSSGNEISLFNAVTALHSLIYKRFGYEDIIHSTSTSIASIYSFNFNSDLDELREIINKNSSIKLDDKIIEYNLDNLRESDIRDLRLSGNNLSREELLEIFFNNSDYREYLITRMNEAKDYQEFKALESIFNYNMISDSVINLYGDYKTYSDYLKDNDYELYTFINENAVDNTSTLKTMDVILYSIEAFLNSSRFDNIFSGLSNQTGNLIKTYIMKIVNIFKAYTIDLQKINFYYTMDDEVWGRIRMFSFIYKYIGFNKADSLSDYMDCIEKLNTFGISLKDTKFKEKYNIKEKHLLSVLIKIIDDCRDYIFKQIKIKFNIDTILADNININNDFNLYINKNIEFSKDRLFNKYEYIIINEKYGGGIFDDKYNPLMDDTQDYVFPDEHFE